MNFSLWLWPYGRWGGLEAMGRATRRAEALGFASVSVSDHTITTTGPESAGMGDCWPDWSVLSAYLATQTSTMRILTSLVIPYRPVFPTAKQIATIDLRIERALHARGGGRLAAARIRDARRRLRATRRHHR